MLLALFAEELGTTLFVTLNPSMRGSALVRLLATTLFSAKLTVEDDGSRSGLSEDALRALARLDLLVRCSEGGSGAVFDPREFCVAFASD